MNKIEYQAAFPELELRYKKSQLKKVKIQDSAGAANTFRQIFNENTIDYREEFYAMYLNRANNTIAWYNVSRGGISGTVADLKIILSLALKVGASGFIVAHNHPSGELKPSEADLSLTKKLKQAGQLLDLHLLDHLILTSEDYISFADKCLID